MGAGEMGCQRPQPGALGGCREKAPETGLLPSDQSAVELFEERHRLSVQAMVGEPDDLENSIDLIVATGQLKIVEESCDPDVFNLELEPLAIQQEASQPLSASGWVLGEGPRQLAEHPRTVFFGKLIQILADRVGVL
jgi:hypothetical protein